MENLAKKRKIGTKEEENRERSWDNLPTDIMFMIMKNLYYGDHVRLHVVSKGWHSMCRVPPRIQEPWLMAFKKNSWTSCKLFDPSYKKTYQIHIDDAGKGLLQGKNLKDIKVHSCTYGWFLLSKSNNPVVGDLFVYSPFANGKIFTLPHLNSSFQIATFSTPLGGRLCVFFTLDAQPDGATVTITTCTKLDKVWTTNTFECKPPVLQNFSNVIYLNGSFYCSTPMGTIGIYNITAQHWSVLHLPKPHWSSWNPDVEQPNGFVDIYMVASRGNILLIYTTERDHHRLSSSPLHYVFRLDRLAMNWKYMTSLGKKNVLFLGQGGCNVSLVHPKRPGNRIYRCSGYRTRCFDLNSNKSDPCYNIYGSLSKAKYKKNWIQNPCGIPTCRDY
ncbi:F-box/kelch-repeat protein [Thalictrum thalictroides]|uniref:F-box/kelch-repeat protein n=1 Tax=Thalictrum thalictroides TaxID=46969 RepID=A0A7J6X796_THATH|nr:F-box/kelch-repeat protein [Thalictrum thalictroides]